MEILENTPHGTKTNIDPDSFGVLIRRQRKTTTSLINIFAVGFGATEVQKSFFLFFFAFFFFFLLSIFFHFQCIRRAAWHILHC